MTESRWKAVALGALGTLTLVGVSVITTPPPAPDGYHWESVCYRADGDGDGRVCESGGWTQTLVVTTPKPVSAAEATPIPTPKPTRKPMHPTCLTWEGQSATTTDGVYVLPDGTVRCAWTEPKRCKEGEWGHERLMLPYDAYYLVEGVAYCGPKPTVSPAP